MKKYNSPTCEIELFRSVDVIAYSAPTPTEATQVPTQPNTDPYNLDKF